MKTKCNENEYLNKEVIRAFLEENNMKQKDLATRLNKSEAQISCYLTHAKPFPRNRADRDLLQQITKLPIDQLLTKIRDYHPRSKKTVTENNDRVSDNSTNLSIEHVRAEVAQRPNKSEDTSKDSAKEDAVDGKSDVKSFMIFVKVFVLVLLCVFCEATFHVFEGMNENPLFNYPLLIFFSTCLVSYTGSEVFISEKDALVFQRTKTLFKVSRELTILWFVIGCAIHL